MVGPTTNYIDSACFQAAFLRSYLGYTPILRYHRPVVPRAVARSSSTTSCQECWKDSVDTPLKYNMENRPIPKRKFYLSGIIFRGKLLNLRGEGYMFWDEVVSFVQWSRGAVPRFFFWQEPSLEQWNQGHLRVDFIHIPYTPNRKAKHFFLDEHRDWGFPTIFSSKGLVHHPIETTRKIWLALGFQV